MSAFDIFDPALAPSEEVDSVEDSLYKEKLGVLSSHYGNDENSPLDRNKLCKEWESFSVMLREHYSMAKTRDVLKDLATDKLGSVYPELACLAKLNMVIPSDCERAFSPMKRIKTQLRNRLKTTTLDNLMRISIEGPSLENFDFEKAVDTWSAIRKRRISTECSM